MWEIPQIDHNPLNTVIEISNINFIKKTITKYPLKSHLHLFISTADNSNETKSCLFKFLF